MSKVDGCIGCISDEEVNSRSCFCEHTLGWHAFNHPHECIKFHACECNAFEEANYEQASIKEEYEKL